jgi:hypothetical protein
MELAVESDEASAIVALHGGPRLIQDPMERVKLRLRTATCGKRRTFSVQRASDLGEPREVSIGHGSNAGPLTRSPPFDPPGHLKPPESLSNRDPADAEVIGQLLLVQPLSGRKLPAHDRLFEDLIELLVQRSRGRDGGKVLEDRIRLQGGTPVIALLA